VKANKNNHEEQDYETLLAERIHYHQHYRKSHFPSYQGGHTQAPLTLPGHVIYDFSYWLDNVVMMWSSFYFLEHGTIYRVDGGGLFASLRNYVYFCRRERL